MSEWKPIDTFPIRKAKKGDFILIHCPDLKRKVLEAYCDWGDAIGYYWTDANGEVYSPTHWMPLPEPPTNTR